MAFEGFQRDAFLWQVREGGALAKQPLKLIRDIKPLPRQVKIRTPEMAVSRHLTVNGRAQPEFFDDRAGPKIHTSSIRLASLASSVTPVPKLSTYTETGCAMPMAYATSISQRSASPAATTFLAIWRTAYAALLSTLLGSLPENAPPPCRA